MSTCRRDTNSKTTEAAMVLRGTGKRKDLLVIYVLRLPLIIDTLLIGVMVSTLTSSVALYGYNL